MIRPLAVVECAAEGKLGRAVRGSAEVVRYELGCYAIFCGDAHDPAAPALVRDVTPPKELLVPDDQAWRDLLWEIHGDALSDRPMRTFSPDSLDSEALSTMASAIPDGYAVGPITVSPPVATSTVTSWESVGPCPGLNVP